MLTLGVIADTHIPDRARNLPLEVLDIFQAAEVTAILHAGDVSEPGVLAQLNEVAPVYAVRGNRDWIRLRYLPHKLKLNFNGVTIAMTHGHGSLGYYFGDKIDLLVKGIPTFDRFEQRVMRMFSDVQVIIFGHIHHPVNRLVDGVLLFNPGSPCCPIPQGTKPSVGLLKIASGGEVMSETVPLP
ncbi:MAG: metallophosphoesterase family protein [Chloroflexota bacterium]